ncbi:amino acid ABC transporter permease [Sphingobium sp. H39-3-25]|uniref:amino acid ABC transporter permease n=1 Tax=Sphingobium arseniciresistens TaxID=3030834 RepID=UPI0023B9ECC5|nr:amino acid ABC transporter permease [Sphingobium arseniciresistens]
MNGVANSSLAFMVEIWPVLWLGLGATLILWVVCAILGFSLGLPLALGRLERSAYLRLPLDFLFEVFRDTPVLVQLIWFYYVFPILAGVHVSAFVAAILGLALNTMAYSSEIFRVGIINVPSGLREAGAALGMKRSTVFRRIIMPHAISHMIPAITNRAVELAKVTSLASVLSVHELMYQGRLLNATYYRPLETFTAVAVVYLIVITPGTMLAAHFERRVSCFA